MARLNVDDNIVTDPRFHALTRLLGGDMEKALGRLIRFWWAAQKYWVQDGHLVPRIEFDIGNFEHLVAVNLAENRQDGIYAKGSERFEWLRNKKEAGRAGGRKSASNRKDQHGTAIPTNARNSPDRIEPESKQCFVEARSSTEARAKHNRNTFNPPALAPSPALAPAQETPIIAAISSVADATSSYCSSPRELAAVWNEECRGAMRRVRLDAMTSRSKRWNTAKARLSEEPDLSHWRTLAQRAAKAPFCLGEVPGRDGQSPWIANFDWFIKADTASKIQEGTYDARCAPKRRSVFADCDNLLTKIAAERKESND